eukprot:CAMPEP_0172176618 /NCGR_PEP_ID=MMETSP1050-20130122/14923_1 /TAXON_ID=233186 /ORGANISM="Cryptomonas curvata, Strain CCAP979/52" /LENGTH=347 /DNA_ID=CAMNT_0012848931 /DNA_START=59 /DNA_END=1098 /DNA_ORIENTATION=-
MQRFDARPSSAPQALFDTLQVSAATIEDPFLTRTYAPSFGSSQQNSFYGSAESTSTWSSLSARHQLSTLPEPSQPALTQTLDENIDKISASGYYPLSSSYRVPIVNHRPQFVNSNRDTMCMDLTSCTDLSSISSCSTEASNLSSISDAVYTLSSQTVHFTNSYENNGGASCHHQQYSDQSYQPSSISTWTAQCHSAHNSCIEQHRYQEPQAAPDAHPHVEAAGHFAGARNHSADAFHQADAAFCAPHRPFADEPAPCPAQHDTWTTGPSIGYPSAPPLPAAPLFASNCAAAPAAPAPAEGSLEHFRNAFIELSRQNFLLRRQLSDAEDKLRSIDAAGWAALAPPPPP